MRPTSKESDELILYPNKLKWILILIGSIGILMLYLSVSATGTQTMLLVLQMAGIGGVLGIATSAVVLWPGSTWLKLTAEGIDYRVMFRRFQYRWTDINRIGVVRVKAGQVDEQFVSFWMKPNDKLVSLHDTFGKKHQQLVDILEAHRARFGTVKH